VIIFIKRIGHYEELHYYIDLLVIFVLSFVEDRQ